jgi:tetratricopeptide (TPR) repeat protein
MQMMSHDQHQQVESALAQAMAHHQAGRLVDAERIYRTILATTPDEPRALHFLGVIALQTGHLSDAEAMLRRALKRAPDMADACSNLGLVLAATSRREEAIVLFERAIALRPDYPEAHYNLGLALEHASDAEQAIASYTRAVEIKPDYGDALCNLGMALHIARSPVEAIPIYRRALAAKPELHRLRIYLAVALAQTGDNEGAHALLNHALALDPKDPIAGLCGALLQVREGDAEAEIELLRRRDAFERSSRGRPTDPVETALQAAIREGTVFIANAKRARNAQPEERSKAQLPSEDKGLEITAFALGAATPPLVVAPPTRNWMDATPNRFAYRCLPMVIANQAGWLLLNPRSFAATWDGREAAAGLTVEHLDAGDGRAAYSHFGSGVLTWDVRYLFRTPPGYNLHVRGPANSPKDGACALEGIVETDWNEATFTMNWKLTRPGLRVVFEAGEPFAMLSPVRRGELEQVRPQILDITTDPQTERAYMKWSALRTQFQRDRHDPRSEGHQSSWQRHYMLGLTVTMKPAPEHQTGLTLRPFVDKRN